MKRAKAFRESECCQKLIALEEKLANGNIFGALYRLAELQQAMLKEIAVLRSGGEVRWIRDKFEHCRVYDSHDGHSNFCTTRSVPCDCGQDDYKEKWKQLIDSNDGAEPETTTLTATEKTNEN